MPPPNLGALRAVSERLDRVGLNYAFVGGSIVNLLLDHPELSPARPTDDVDVVIEAVASDRYAEVEARLRRAGMDHDMRPGAPRCRWVLGGVTVDVMPSEGDFLGLNTAWFREVLETASEHSFGPTRLRLVSPAAFLATKYVAFRDRGAGDYFGSHDLEDLVTVVDGRAQIVDDVERAPAALRRYVAESIDALLRTPVFDESLAGFLPSDRASQQRLPLLRRKLEAIARLR